MPSRPPSLALTTDEPDYHEVERREGGYICSINSCNTWFKDKTGIQAHIRKIHGYRSLIKMATLTNHCPRCLTIFSDRNAAKTHFENSVRNRICKKK